MYIFNQAEFATITTFKAYSAFSNKLSSNMLHSLAMVVVVIIDIIFLLTNDQSRSLHDRIGKTYVIKK
jgi:hypothetical protein